MADVEWVDKVTYAGYFEIPLETAAPPTDLQNVLRDVEPGTGTEGDGGTSVTVAVGESDSLGIAFMTYDIGTGPYNLCVSLEQTLRAIILTHSSLPGLLVSPSFSILRIS